MMAATKRNTDTETVETLVPAVLSIQTISQVVEVQGVELDPWSQGKMIRLQYSGGLINVPREQGRAIRPGDSIRVTVEILSQEG